jgi:flagellar biosynthesis protein FlhG
MAQSMTIIPVAGGKGGVGKTFLTANLAVALALRGQPTIAVDLDLGNSNLHSFLRLENKYAGVGEFLRGRIKCAPEELIVRTSVPGLGFIAGDGRMPFMANITYNQKRTLLRLLKLLPARYVLLDLSAGTSFNTLDLFLAGDQGILVTTPEHPSLMNMLVFMKNLVLRALEQSLRGETAITEKLNELYKQSVHDQLVTVTSFRRELRETHPEAAAKVEAVCRRIRPRLVYNMVESMQDTEIFARIDRTFAEVLSVACDHFGLIPYDASVRESVRRPGIFLLQSNASRTGEMIDKIAERVIRFWDTPVEGSAQLLADYARMMLAQPQGPSVGDGHQV